MTADRSPGRVVVAGSLNVDLVARVERLPRAGETVSGSDLERTPGGKGLNQAVAVARAGVEVVMHGAVGHDEHGRWLRDLARSEGIDVDGVVVTDTATGTALITVGLEGANTIVVSAGANGRASGDLSSVAGLGPADVVLCQAETPVAAVVSALRAARAAGATTVVNQAPFRPLDDDLWALVDVLVVNETELAGLLAEHAPDLAVPDEDASHGRAHADAEAAARGLLRARPGPALVVVTLGRHGAVAVGPHGPGVAVAGRTVDAVDTVGAGDCLTGWLAAGLARGRSPGAALARAVAAASLVVQRVGAATAMPTAAEVDHLA
jgi:ribokinase